MDNRMKRGNRETSQEIIKGQRYNDFDTVITIDMDRMCFGGSTKLSDVLDMGKGKRIKNDFQGYDMSS